MSYSEHSEGVGIAGRAVLPAMILCHVSGLIFLPLMPVLFETLAQAYFLSPLQLGAIGSVQLGCTAIGAFLLTRLGAGISCRALVVVAITVELLVNSACVFLESIEIISVLRGVAGLAEGVLLAGASAGAVIKGRTAQYFVYYNIGLALFAVASLVGGAGVVQQFGYSAGFALIAVVNFTSLLLIYAGFPGFKLKQTSDDEISNIVDTHQLTKAFLALVFFGVALAGTQAFIGRFSESHGISVEAISFSLGVGWSIAILTPLLVMPLINRAGVVIPLIVGYLILFFIVVALSLLELPAMFLIVAALFTPTALFIQPLQFGVLGAIDPGGRLAALGPAAISVGSATGPVLVGVAVGFWGLGSVGIVAAGMLILSIVSLYPLMNISLTDRS